MIFPPMGPPPAELPEYPVVQLPVHETLDPRVLDPNAGTPEYKGFLVKIERA